MTTTAQEALRRMQDDPDVKREEEDLVHVKNDFAGAEEKPSEESSRDAATGTPPTDVVPLNVVSFSHRPNAQTKRLLESVGGLAKLREFTATFYAYAFQDPRIDTFIREHDDHHGERFASWIAEKFGDPTKPWSTERATREVCPFSAHGYRLRSAHDRSSAHFAAWHSPKRSAADWGSHFGLEDCRVWMRLHFLAAREAGVLETAFGSYYVRFIAHFVSVYERTAPSFARDSARWSADPANVRAYIDRGRTMPDVTDVSYEEALRQIPEDERGYTGSGAEIKKWPYELR